MAITLTSAFLAELKKNVNSPNIVIEVALDSGTIKWGMHMAGFSDVQPIVKSVSSLQNKIDPKEGYTTRGQLTVVITGRDNFKSLIANNYLKNRRVTRKDGFVVSGFQYSDYAATFTGKIADWSRKGDELTLVIADEMMINTTKKLPVENATKTQSLNYQNMHPADIMTDMLQTQLGISASYLDTAKFASERDNWLLGWKFERVLVEPLEANKYLNELQMETNSFIIHDGEKVSYKVFAPPVPGQTIEEWLDNYHIQDGSLSMKSGYKDAFFNRVLVYYDYDETGQDKEANYDSVELVVDSASQGSGQWNEASTKVIKSKWIRSFTYNQPSNVTGVVIYGLSRLNGAGAGYLTYTRSTNSLQWTAPGASIGAAVPLTKDGRYQLFAPDTTKYIRVVVDTASLPVTDKVDTITITAINGSIVAKTLAQKMLNQYRDPVASASFEVDINNVAWNAQFIKPTDIKDITTDEALEKGMTSWSKERVMLTSIRPDFAANKVAIEAIDAKFYKRYGFIAPAGYPDYPSATAAQREYGFIGDSNNKVNAGAVDGYYIW